MTQTAKRPLILDQRPSVGVGKPLSRLELDAPHAGPKLRSSALEQFEARYLSVTPRTFNPPINELWPTVRFSGEPRRASACRITSGTYGLKTARGGKGWLPRRTATARPGALQTEVASVELCLEWAWHRSDRAGSVTNHNLQGHPGRSPGQDILRCHAVEGRKEQITR